MEWLVQEIQKNIINNEKVTDILRKALILAKKLKIKELLSLVTSELNWYKGSDTIPRYRNISWYQIVWWNPYHWWVPCILDNNDLFEAATNTVNTDSISQIQELIESNNDFMISLPSETYSEVFANRTEYRLKVTRHEFTKIIDAVKNELLEICLKLEESWITWKWINFSKEEIQKATTINNYFNWTVSDSQLQQNSTNSDLIYNKWIDIEKTTDFINNLLESIENSKKINETDKQLIDEWKKIKKEIKKENPNKEIINEWLNSIRSILEWTTWNMLYQWIMLSMWTF